MHLEPLGDQAVLAYCDDEAQATQLTAAVRQARSAWCIEVVQAYLSVAVYYDILTTDFNQVADWMAALPLQDASSNVGRLHRIPCCYEFGPDFDRIQQHTGLNREHVIALHTGTTFTIYAIGFCPGFPYLGYLPEPLCAVPRHASPRLKVEEGSVGLTGRQTGIYTEVRPGGWNIIGLTPLKLVDVREEYFPLRTGERVQFEAITKRTFRQLKGKRLDV